MQIWDLFLWWTQREALLPLLVLGAFLPMRHTFWHAFLCMGLVMLVNPMLKQFFAIPLLPTVGHPGFAFPSGHMIAAVGFYGYLAWALKWRWVKCLLYLLLLAIGIALVAKQYHTWIDVVGACGFGSFFIGMYRWALACYRGIVPWGYVMMLVYAIVMAFGFYYLPVWPMFFNQILALMLGLIMLGHDFSKIELSTRVRWVGGVLSLGAGVLLIELWRPASMLAQSSLLFVMAFMVFFVFYGFAIYFYKINK